MDAEMVMLLVLILGALLGAWGAIRGHHNRTVEHIDVTARRRGGDGRFFH